MTWFWLSPWRYGLIALVLWPLLAYIEKIRTRGDNREVSTIQAELVVMLIMCVISALIALTGLGVDYGGAIITGTIGFCVASLTGWRIWSLRRLLDRAPEKDQ